MERFVRSIAAGGILLVAGLWLADLFAPASAPWLVGAALAVVGTAGLVAGIGRRIEPG
ncbi:MAG: hypothetical protein ABEJ81_09240 [Haloferacaceae archaeon]